MSGSDLVVTENKVFSLKKDKKEKKCWLAV
jgi:hypothetical protein